MANGANVNKNEQRNLMIAALILVVIVGMLGMGGLLFVTTGVPASGVNKSNRNKSMAMGFGGSDNRQKTTTTVNSWEAKRQGITDVAERAIDTVSRAGLSPKLELEKDKKEAKKAAIAFAEALRENRDIDDYLTKESEGIRSYIKGKVEPIERVKVLERPDQKFYGIGYATVRACDKAEFCQGFNVVFYRESDGKWRVYEIKQASKSKVKDCLAKPCLTGVQEPDNVIKEFLSLIRKGKQEQAKGLFTRAKIGTSTWTVEGRLSEINKRIPFDNTEILCREAWDEVPFDVLFGNKKGDQKGVRIVMAKQVNGKWKIKNYHGAGI
ncbi:hypothetical protein KAS79_03005 [Candidatus Parcubacteria bacterium]|nr:hypothetical protein [Candidatus Parcubacteria bacterium]